MYRIGEFSRICQATVKTLRYYDEIGLLIPDNIDKFTNYRYYSSFQINTYYNIITLKELGLTLEEIKDNLSSITDEFIMKRKKVIESEIRERNSRLKTIEALKDNLIKGKNMKYNVVIKINEDIHCAGIRKIVKNRTEIVDVLKETKDILEKNNIKHDNPIIINNEIEYSEKDLDLIVAYSLSNKLSHEKYKKMGLEEYNESSDFEFADGSKLFFASIVCHNNTDSINEAYSVLMKYVHDNDYQLTGRFIEKYLDIETVEIKASVNKIKDRTQEEINEYFKREEKYKQQCKNFKDFPKLIGKWQLLDILPAPKMFNPLKTKYNGINDKNQIEFKSNGKTSVENMFWTRADKIDGVLTQGYLIITKDNITIYNHFDLYKINNLESEYLLILIKDENSIYKTVLPLCYFYKKI